MMTTTKKFVKSGTSSKVKATKITLSLLLVSFGVTSASAPSEF